MRLRQDTYVFQHSDVFEERIVHEIFARVNPWDKVDAEGTPGLKCWGSARQAVRAGRRRAGQPFDLSAVQEGRRRPKAAYLP